MIKVWIGVRNEAASFAVAVYAESIRQAVQIAKDGYPGSHVTLTFPIPPDDFFVKSHDLGGPVDSELMEKIEEASKASTTKIAR